MIEHTTNRFAPLAGWLIFVFAVATLFPLNLEQITALLAGVTLLALIWLPGRLRRSIPFLLLYVAMAFLALKLPIPLPNTFHPLAQLLSILAIWSVLLILSLGLLMSYLMRTAVGRQPKQHHRQSNQQKHSQQQKTNLR